MGEQTTWGFASHQRSALQATCLAAVKSCKFMRQLSQCKLTLSIQQTFKQPIRGRFEMTEACCCTACTQCCPGLYNQQSTDDKDCIAETQNIDRDIQKRPPSSLTNRACLSCHSQMHCKLCTRLANASGKSGRSCSARLYDAMAVSCRAASL